MNNDIKEYVVTLRNKSDLDDFYDDMETPGGNLYIPDRQVEVAQRRKISRNTHYYLTPNEAEQLKNDPRVLSVSLTPKSLGLQVKHLWEQTADFEKSNIFTSADKNWGLYRITQETNLANWATDGLFTKTTQTVKTTSSGKHVDVVIVDSHINPNHPEFAVNSDGSGGTRVNLFDWFTLSEFLGIDTSEPYDYSNISSNHGTHVAGTACGNTQGWARNSNIYNIEFNYAGIFDPGNWELYLFDYLRFFHLNKPINPITGRRNPTITNHSWGYSYIPISLSIVEGHTFRGVYTDISSMSTGDKKNSLEANGVPVPYNTLLVDMPATYAALDADIQDAIDDGIIIISAAGNSFWNTVKSDNIDYDNSIRILGDDYYHSRGSYPSSAPGVISVGNITTFYPEYKNESSNYGDRVDIWAPGTNIISSVYDAGAAEEFSVPVVNDPRDSNYKLASISGTSMASPQAAGIIACYAEQNPNMKQTEVLEYLITHSHKDQIQTFGTDYGDYYWLGSSNNRYLYYRLERQLIGHTFPKKTFKNRPSNGISYPRTRIRARG